MQHQTQESINQVTITDN